MRTVLVTQSPSHPVRTDLFANELASRGTYEVTRLDLPAGQEAKVDEGRIVDALDGCQAWYKRAGSAPRTILEAAPDLQLVALYGSGFDSVDIPAATENGVAVTHSPTAPGPAVVEHVFLLVFTLLRNLPAVLDRTDAGVWERTPGKELGRSVIGVVGLGTTGFGVARRAGRCFDADVLGYDPYVTGDRQSPIYPRYSRETVTDAGVELVGLHPLFDRSDIVVVTVPLTDETRRMIGDEELALLGDGYLVNTARGGIVDEPALVDAVEGDRIGGVALDVLQAEPPPSDHPLFDNESVIITPHIASVTEGFFERSPRLAAEKIDTFFRGRTPDGLLNPEITE